MDMVRQYQGDIKGLPDFRNDPALTADLISKMKARDMVAKMSLIESTLNYIFKLANAYCRRENAWRHLIDLVQEANKRVTSRIAHFDPKRASLKTFVYLCSSTAFSEYSAKTGIVSFTRHRRRMARYLRYEFAQLSEELGREPTDEELGQRMHMTQGSLRELRSASGIGIVELDSPAGGRSGATTIGDGLASSARASDSLLTKSAEVAQLYEYAVECLGKVDADLWLAFKTGRTEFFYELYFTQTGQGKDAARAFIYRRNKKLKNYVEKKTRRSKLGGNYEFPTARSG